MTFNNRLSTPKSNCAFSRTISGFNQFCFYPAFKKVCRVKLSTGFCTAIMYQDLCNSFSVLYITVACFASGYHLTLWKCFCMETHTVCLIAGISMLQGGPMPSFFSDEQLQKLLRTNTLVHSETQFCDGLNVLRVVDVSTIVPHFQCEVT